MTAVTPPPRPPRTRSLELRGITKIYETPDGPAVHRFTALNGISLRLRTGCIHAVLGENGAGKSTLMHVISGLIPPTEGELILDGRRLERLNPARALGEGIAMVHQRPRLADNLSTLENAIVGLPGIRARLAERESRLRKLAGEWVLPVDVRQKARNLSPAGKLFAALLSVLMRDPDFLVLDEPTSVLAPEDRERFMESARAASSRGLGILLITHKLDEALRWADRITVLRHGSIAFDSPATASGGRGAISRDDLAALLDPVETGAGAYPVERGGPERKKPFTCRLRAEGLSASPRDRDPVRGISFTAESGSVTAIFGAPGSGLKTLEDILSGMLGSGEGTISLERDGARPITLPAAKLNPEILRKEGVAFVPSNRSRRGSDPALSVADMLLPYRQNRLFRDPAGEREFVRSVLSAERIEALPSRGALTLSGGQLQRLILARELSESPAVLILAEPEWGLDVRSAAILRERIRKTADSGTAVLVLTDTPDTMHGDGFYDAVYALREGVIR